MHFTFVLINARQFTSLSEINNVFVFNSIFLTKSLCLDTHLKLAFQSYTLPLDPSQPLTFCKSESIIKTYLHAIKMVQNLSAFNLLTHEYAWRRVFHLNAAEFLLFIEWKIWVTNFPQKGIFLEGKFDIFCVWTFLFLDCLEIVSSGQTKYVKWYKRLSKPWSWFKY